MTHNISTFSEDVKRCVQQIHTRGTTSVEPISFDPLFGVKVHTAIDKPRVKLLNGLHHGLNFLKFDDNPDQRVFDNVKFLTFGIDTSQGCTYIICSEKKYFCEHTFSLNVTTFHVNFTSILKRYEDKIRRTYPDSDIVFGGMQNLNEMLHGAFASAFQRVLFQILNIPSDFGHKLIPIESIVPQLEFWLNLSFSYIKTEIEKYINDICTVGRTCDYKLYLDIFDQGITHYAPGDTIRLDLLRCMPDKYKLQ